MLQGAAQIDYMTNLLALLFGASAVSLQTFCRHLPAQLAALDQHPRSTSIVVAILVEALDMSNAVPKLSQ